MLIDLGEVPQPRQQPVAVEVPRPPVPFRAVCTALSVVLVALLAGGSHRAPQPPPTVIPAVLGDATFLAGDRLFVVGVGRETDPAGVKVRVISSYSLPDGGLLDRTPVTVSGTVGAVVQAGDTIVAEYQDVRIVPSVVAQSAGAGQALWRRSARLIGVRAADGIALLHDDRGMLAVDLTTGAVRWSVPRPADGVVAEAGAVDGYPRWLVLVTDSGRLETRDARTGELIAARTLTAVAGRAQGQIWPVGDLLLVNAGRSGHDGYRLPGLDPLWRTTADLSQAWTQVDCGTLICVLRQRRGVIALDRASGREVWRSNRWLDAESAGPYLLAFENPGGADVPRLRVVDPATGRQLGDFGDWERLGPAGADGLVYGKLDTPDRNRIRYGELDPATRRVRPLGSADGVSGGCETGARVLICRLVDASIAVWRLG